MMETLAFRSPINNAPVYFKPRVSSTMDEAVVLADASAAPGTVILTDFQEQGRGRREADAWQSAPGENLLFTVLLERGTGPADLLKTPLVCGLAVALALESLFPLSPLIKWPNDVLVRGKKICGILCQTRGRLVLAGIGINCNQTVFPGALAGRASSLALELGASVDGERLLIAVLESLDRWLDSPSWRPEIEARLAYRGERRRLVHGEGLEETIAEGMVEGLGESGELILRTPAEGGRERFFSGSLVE
jgi:BirA family biotin operon repressor/biotin-[acetyl-CoA-carboxylase] ligase